MVPSVTYRVPSGWYNSTDEGGEFSLVPPGGTLAGVDAGTSDFIGVYAQVAAPDPNCGDGQAPGVGTTPSAIAAWIARQPGLSSTKARVVLVSGRKALVQDITLAKVWKKTCPWSSGNPVVPLLMGIKNSNFSHAVGPHYAVRLYLMPAGPDVMAIEVDDATGGQHFNWSTNVINSFRFGEQ